MAVVLRVKWMTGDKNWISQWTADADDDDADDAVNMNDSSNKKSDRLFFPSWATLLGSQAKQQCSLNWTRRGEQPGVDNHIEGKEVQKTSLKVDDRKW